MEQNKKIMERFVEFINSGNMEIGKEIIAPDVIFYAPTSPNPMYGIEGYAAVLKYDARSYARCALDCGGNHCRWR